MFRIKLQICFVYVMFSCFFVFADAKIMTTNDIDAVFQGMDVVPRPPFWNRCQRSGLMDTTIPQSEIRRYALDRLLALSVSTNTPRFIAVMQSNADYITRAESIFGMKLGDQELKKILSNVGRYSVISTNDFASIRARACELYRKKYGRNPHYAGRGFRREFIDEWHWHRDSVLDWNKAVSEYRRKLITFVCRKYHEIHADVPEKERTEALVRFLAEYGFSLPESNASAND